MKNFSLFILLVLLTSCGYDLRNRLYCAKRSKVKTKRVCENSIAGGAFLGFLVAGPIGAAIGGAAGSDVECYDEEYTTCEEYKRKAVCVDNFDSGEVPMEKCTKGE